MPRRQLLTAAQRTRFDAVLSPTGEDVRLFTRYYTLSQSDLAQAQGKRGAHNQLGFAVQLCYARFPGRALRGGEHVPAELLDYLASQLGLESACFSDYGGRNETRREHLAQLKALYGFCSWADADYAPVAEQVHTLALETGRGAGLVGCFYEIVRHQRLLAPGPTVVERFVAEVLYRAEQTTFTALTNDLSPEQKRQLDQLLTLRPSEGQTWLSWLRRGPGRTSSSGMIRLLDRLEHVLGLKLGSERAKRVHRNRLLKLAREGAKMSAHHLLDFEELRRYATLVALMLETGACLLDDLIEMQDRLLLRWQNTCKLDYAQRLAQDKEQANEGGRLYVKIGQALIHAREQSQDPWKAIESVLPWEAFVQSVTRTKGASTCSDYLALLDSRYPVARRHTPRFLAILELSASSGTTDLINAIELLKQLNTGARSTLGSEAPTSFIRRRWRPLVFDDGRINRRFYEMCVLFELRDRIRAGDVTVRGSHKYREFDEYLLDESAFEQMFQDKTLAVAVETDFDAYIGQRLTLLARRLSEVEHSAKRGELEGISFKGDKLSISPLNRSVPEKIEALTRKVYALVPEVKISELLAEVEAWTCFGARFTHLRDGSAIGDPIVLLAALLADATNLGHTRMAQACPHLSCRQLWWTADWYLRQETYAQALATLVDFHHSLPFAAHWGSGTASSSDGQRFKAAGPARGAARVNARYGQDPIVTFYTHLSDQYAPFNVNVIDSTDRDATYVLDGLVGHESELQIEEHYTDTSGFTDHVFALCHLLGFRFVPRIRNLAGHRIYRPSKTPTHDMLSGLLGDVVQPKRIRSHWKEVLRVATSIKQGTTSASLLLRRLGGYPRQNGLARALREVGRIERSLHMLAWIEDVAYRRRALLGLNKGESKHTLSRALYFGRRGEVRERSRDNQLRTASGLILVMAAIVLWNTVYLDRAVNRLKADGEKIDEELLGHISPLGWEHINLIGDYVWRNPDNFDFAQLRPLRRLP